MKRPRTAQLKRNYPMDHSRRENDCLSRNRSNTTVQLYSAWGNQIPNFLSTTKESEFEDRRGFPNCGTKNTSCTPLLPCTSPPDGWTFWTETYVWNACKRIQLSSHCGRSICYCRSMYELFSERKPIQSQATTAVIHIMPTTSFYCNGYSKSSSKNHLDNKRIIVKTHR